MTNDVELRGAARPVARRPVPRIALSWHGMPQFAARLFRATIERLGEPCAVVGSKPEVPVRGMEEALGQPIHWVDAGRPASWRELDLPTPEIFVQSGWSYPALSALGREVKAAGGRVIGLSDTNWRGDFRQRVLGPLGFRLLHRRHFDAMLVPGRQGARVMRYLGMPGETTRIGMLGADPAIFGPGPTLRGRAKTFLFVGRFAPCKNVLGLTRAFLRFVETRPDWTLRLCGSGEQRDDIPTHSRIVVEEFVQPEHLQRHFHAARFFVLPSHTEPWGMVVHEAALCGCALLLSHAIGSADDLASPLNSLRFPSDDEEATLRALAAAAERDDAWLDGAEAESLARARQFGPARFASEIARIVATFDAER